MAFTVTLFTFSKNTSSTARPDLSTGKDYNCVLKANCGKMAPRIELDLGLTTAPVSNYAMIRAFGRYYYITEWQYEGRLWVAYLEEDVLATWKDYIGKHSYYVLRASNGWDGNITDDMYPTYPAPTVVTHEGNKRLWLPDLSQGTYVVGVINDSGAAMGAVGYYVFTNTQFRTLCARLMENTSWLNVPTEISQGGIDDGLLRTLFNPFQYIVSCKWFPFNAPTGDSLDSLPYGWWRLNNVSCSRLAGSAIYSGEIDFDISHHPQADSRGNYLNCSPFTTMTLSMEPFGSIVVDPSYFTANSTLVTITSVDCVSGIGTLEIMKPVDSVFKYPKNVVKRAQCDFGVNIQLAQMAVDRLTQAESVITGAAGVTRDVLSTAAQATNISNLMNPVSGELSAAASGAQTVATATHAIADGIRSSIPQMQTSGINGSLAAYAVIPILRQEFYRIVDEDIQDNGRPYCKTTTPETLGGYMLIRNANVQFPGTINEIASVKAYLEAGFYYE